MQCSVIGVTDGISLILSTACYFGTHTWLVSQPNGETENYPYFVSTAQNLGTKIQRRIRMGCSIDFCLFSFIVIPWNCTNLLRIIVWKEWTCTEHSMTSSIVDENYYYCIIIALPRFSSGSQCWNLSLSSNSGVALRLKWSKVKRHIDFPSLCDRFGTKIDLRS